jgi:hypothetical protein
VERAKKAKGKRKGTQERQLCLSWVACIFRRCPLGVPHTAPQLQVAIAVLGLEPFGTSDGANNNKAYTNNNWTGSVVPYATVTEAGQGN